jgi:hypothetical protein
MFADMVEANKRWRKCRRDYLFIQLVSRYQTLSDRFLLKNLRGLLECGVQKSMDMDKPKGPVDPSAPPLAIETMLGYARSIGTALWYELGRDRGKVG